MEKNMSEKLTLPFSEAQIGYRTYEFVILTKKQAEKEIDSDYGHCCHLEGKIKLNEKLGEDRIELANTVLHELLHTCYYIYHITDRDNEEDTVRPMANALCELWQRNPKIFDWLKENLVSNDRI